MATNFRALRYRTDPNPKDSRDHPKGLGFDLNSAWVSLPGPGLPVLPALGV